MFVYATPPPANVFPEAEVRLTVPVPVTVKFVEVEVPHAEPALVRVQVPEPTATVLVFELEEVAKAVETPAVEAAERNVRPAIFTAPRSPIVSKASYLEHSIRAALGNEDSRQYVMAADTTGNNSAFIPTPQSTEVINGIANADRGFIGDSKAVLEAEPKCAVVWIRFKSRS